MTQHTIDKIDKNILEAIQADANMSNLELAEKICLSPSPCSRRVKILEDAGYIRGKVTLLNPEKIGLPVNVFVQVSLIQKEKSKLDDFERRVTSWSEVMECYLLAGDIDYLIRVSVSDLNSYQKFLDTKLTQFEGIKNIRSTFSLKQVLYKTELPLDHLGV